MSTAQQPLRTLEPGMDEKKQYDGYYYGGGNFVWYVLWFIIIAVIVWLILWSTKPTWVQKTDKSGNFTGEVDGGKVLLWAIVIAIVICIIFWIIFAAWGGPGGRYGGKSDHPHQY